MEAIGNFFEALPTWLNALTLLVTGATAITALTPTQMDNKAVDWLLAVLNLVAGNVGKNKNADAP